jgi:hypothetical protein
LASTDIVVGDQADLNIMAAQRNMSTMMTMRRMRPMRPPLM